MVGFKSKLKLLALRQQRYAKNLNCVNSEIYKLLEEQGISSKDINNTTILMCEPEIITQHLLFIDSRRFESLRELEEELIQKIEGGYNEKMV